MGIPFLFYHIVKGQPDLVTSNISNNVDRLFLDFNSIIHMCSAAVVTKLVEDDEYLFMKIFDKIIEHTITQIVERCMPSELLYIAIDGVAPLAKIQQQRKRRYMSTYRNELLNDFKQKNNIPVVSWDSNIITPGTDFMNRLDRFLAEYFTSHKFPFKVIVSGSNEHGEGEHKIVQYIKANGNTSNDKVDVIYGLDADLIMLCLTCEKSNIYLMRESSSFDDIADNKSFFKFLNIDKLRSNVAQQLSSTKDIRYMRDYVALCYFLGNDFLPCLPFLKIKHRGIDVLKSCYVSVKNNFGGDANLVCEEEGKCMINEEFLTALLEKLSIIEDDEMLRMHEDWIKHNVSFRKAKIDSPLDCFSNSIENYPHTCKRKSYLQKNLAMNTPKWRNYYYHELFGNQKIVQEIASKYIEGITWITDYYFNSKSNNMWSFHYGYAPTALDLYMNRFKEPRSKTHNECDKEITPALQLALVLPPQSISKIIPSFPIKNKKIAHMFPYSFNIEVYLKNQLWECVPCLPMIDIDKLIDVVKNIQ